MNLSLFVVVIITAIALVVAALGIARAISPRSFNSQKGEAYECGIPTRGKSWMQFKVGYYLFAILFLMFDVEAVFLFPWAVTVQEIGVMGLVSVLFFLVVLLVLLFLFFLVQMVLLAFLVFSLLFRRFLLLLVLHTCF